MLIPVRAIIKMTNAEDSGDIMGSKIPGVEQITAN
jgi:hypothetical protein